MGLDIDIMREQGRVAVVVLTGDLDAYTVRSLDQLREQWAGERLAIDLTRVEFIDSAGLSALHRFRSVEPDATPPVIMCAPGNIRRIFTIAGLEDAFDIRMAGDLPERGDTE